MPAPKKRCCRSDGQSDHLAKDRPIHAACHDPAWETNENIAGNHRSSISYRTNFPAESNHPVGDLPHSANFQAVLDKILTLDS